MAEKRLQKVFYYNSKETKEIIEGFLEDASAVTGRSASFIIETYIFAGFLPKNKIVSSWIKYLYLKDENGNDYADIKKTMDAVFCFLSAGRDFKPANPYGKPIVEYAHRNISITNKRVDKYKVFEGDVSYFVTQLGYMIERVELYKDYIVEDSMEEKRRAQELRFSLNELKRIKEQEDITQDSLSFIYGIILGNWDMLGDTTYTYRLLVAISRIQIWTDTPDTRMELIECLNDFAKKLDEEEE